jgi:predicted Ser/Thr protein kinase
VSATGCPSEDELAAYVAGDQFSRADRVLAHLDECSSCRRAVSALAVTSRTELVAGTRLGRFEMRRLLGKGAMGDVWAAYDPELDREVAIKLLRVTSARLRREAQAMARVHHPNVVRIYDLGTADDHAFCAMELVDGETLRTWMSTPRPWRSALRVAIEAGRGLAAAHATGVIHRDIKPENVLIARDGRTLVTDFGLAKLAGPDDEDRAAGHAEGSESVVDASSTHLTAQGALVGTVAYMSPEQLAGEPASMLSDQFSYCVLVYETLFGARPFQAATIGKLRDAIQARVKAPTDLRGMPKRVVGMLERGLARAPSARWPTMDALLGALQRALVRRRRWVVAAIPLALAASAANVYFAERGPSEAEARAVAERTISEAWNPLRSSMLDAAFIATDAAHGADRAAGLTRVLDQYREQWLAQRIDAWAATHVRREQTIELLERRLACFDRLAEAMGQVVTLLSAPNRDEVARAPEIAKKLEPIANCSNERRLGERSLAPSSPEGRSAARELQELEALQVLGRHDEALRRAEALVDKTSALDEPMLHARARFNLGVALQNAERDDEAERVLRLAVQDAAAARDHYLVASVWLHLVELVGLRRPKDATR